MDCSLQYIAGVFKPPSPRYNGGFLDLQSIIHHHILNAGREIEEENIIELLTPAERTLIYGGQFGIRLFPKWLNIRQKHPDKNSPDQGDPEPLAHVLEKVCLLCHSQQQHFLKEKDREWCQELPNYIAEALNLSVDFDVAIIPLLLPSFTLTPTTICGGWKVLEFVDQLPLSQSEKTLFTGILIGALYEWLSITTEQLRTTFTPIRYMEAGMPLKSECIN